MNQIERLLNHLQNNRTVRLLEALSKLGIYRLSDTVFKLRKQGYNINTKLVEVRNQFDETCHVAEYELMDI